MSDLRDTPVLAIDGGGTRCRMAYGVVGRHIVVEGGAANVSTDFAAALREIHALLGALSAKTGIGVETLYTHRCFVGLAGVTGDAMVARLRAALPFAQCRIADDRAAALRASLGAGDGMIAHCGTGSFFGRQIAGVQGFVGGWGFVLGDEASAHWLGRAALRATLETEDGRHPPSGLAQSLIARFGDAAGLVEFATHARPADFGALAPVVTEAACAGDALARGLMAHGAHEIARALAHLGWHAGLHLCLTGGVGPQYAPYLPQAMQGCVIPAQAQPIIGALALAQEIGEGTKS
ncbi:ATPase [Rhodobacteraceae bacterium XHP0102]|nr:ATPase [Rhodobacteraceae bacterium XHP0102]